MRDLKNSYKKIVKKFDQKLKLKKDMTYTKSMKNRIFSVSEEFCQCIKQNKELPLETLSELEKTMAKIDSCYDKSKIVNIINYLEEYCNKLFVEYEKRIQSSKDSTVSLEIQDIKDRLNELILEMKDITEDYEDIDKIKTLVLNKCLHMSSDLEENRYNNLSENFSYLEGAIEKYYEKKEKNIKCVAIGTAAAIGAAGIGVGASMVVDYRADQMNEALKVLYGSEEGIPDYVHDELFTKIGTPIRGSKENLKGMLLSETLQNIVNNDLQVNTNEGYIENLELGYGKEEYKENTDRGPKITQTDGYTISFNVNGDNEKEYILSRKDVHEGLLKDGLLEHVVKDREAKEIRRWLEGLSIKECVNILKGDCRIREKFEKHFEKPIMEMENTALESLVDKLSNDRNQEGEELVF